MHEIVDSIGIDPTSACLRLLLIYKIRDIGNRCWATANISLPANITGVIAMQLEFQMKNNPSHVIISQITTFISSRSGRRSVNQRRYCFKSIRGARGRGVGTDNLQPQIPIKLGFHVIANTRRISYHPIVLYLQS